MKSALVPAAMGLFRQHPGSFIALTLLAPAMLAVLRLLQPHWTRTRSRAGGRARAPQASPAG